MNKGVKWLVGTLVAAVAVLVGVLVYQQLKPKPTADELFMQALQDDWEKNKEKRKAQLEKQKQAEAEERERAKDFKIEMKAPWEK